MDDHDDMDRLRIKHLEAVVWAAKDFQYEVSRSSHDNIDMLDPDTALFKADAELSRVLEVLARGDA